MRVVIDKNYNRALARPLFNCRECFGQKERSKNAQGSQLARPGDQEERAGEAEGKSGANAIVA